MELPNGNYVARAYISVDTVDDDQSPDYGKRKFVFELAIIEGKYKDAVVYANRMIQPHYLADEPAPTNETAVLPQSEVFADYLRDTNSILGKCGVEVSETNATRIVQSIAESNIRQPVVSFMLNNGVPTISRFIRFEINEKFLNVDLSLPDGNDAPFGN